MNSVTYFNKKKTHLTCNTCLLESSKLTAITRSTVSFSAKRGHRERVLPSSLSDVFSAY